MTLQTITWKVAPTTAPALVRHCPRCGQSRYIQSGRFRVNAQKRSLDVWLIYRCETCENSYNLPVYSRVSPGSIPRDVYAKLLANDAALAQTIACDTALLKVAGVQAEPRQGLCIQGEDLPRGTPCRLVVENPAGITIRLDKLLAQKTGLSRSRVQALLAAGRVVNESDGKAPAARVKNGMRLLVDFHTKEDYL